MSLRPAHEPECTGSDLASEVETVIEVRPRDIDGLSVRRVLPSVARRTVGPFIFFDHMGPASLPAGKGMDVRPHPHINLATVTYLFRGEIVHRDSLGSHQPIRPGAINWMTAGRGIVHSERTGDDERARGPELHGIQLWIALPKQHEETEPAFHHHPADALPQLDVGGVPVKLLAGSAYGATAPVSTFSPMFYAEAKLRAGTQLPLPTEHAERAAYLVSGSIGCGDDRFEAPRMLVFHGGGAPVLRAETDAHLMLVGGAPLDGPRHLWWNFVSSRPERLEQAKADWKAQRFPKVPGDEDEFIPLPER